MSHDQVLRMARAIENLCVFCGSNAGRQPQYAEAAVRLAACMTDRDIGLVYGGGSVGLMNVIADAMLERGGRVVGVIPRLLRDREVAHEGLTELHVVETMHERKALMAERSDAVVALPGGFGTIDELFETLTWTQLGIHGKPCGLLDVAGYFTDLVAFVDHSVAEGFVSPAHRALLFVDDQPTRLLDSLCAFEPPAVGKWAPPP